MLARKTPLKRTGFKRKPGAKKKMAFISTIGLERSRELDEYSRRRKAYLAEHPLCQIFIARNRLSEGDLIRALKTVAILHPPVGLQYATEIHHRNKRNGRRLNIERFWMACCREQHEWVESHKDEARKLGLLCPINADPEGVMPNGSVCLPTSELIIRRAEGKDA